MVEYDTDVLGYGCVLIVRIRGEHKGPLDPEILEQIDEQVIEHSGSERTGTRVGVESTKTEFGVSIEYAFQESFLAWGLMNLQERVEAFTDLKDPVVVADVATAEFVNRKRRE